MKRSARWKASGPARLFKEFMGDRHEINNIATEYTGSGIQPTRIVVYIRTCCSRVGMPRSKKFLAISYGINNKEPRIVPFSKD
jgi:hypothetical protein